jgi:ribosomal protein S4
MKAMLSNGGKAARRPNIIKCKTVPSWLSLDRENVVGQVLTLPSAEAIESKFESTSIVEWYSR